jgi:GNAT superfamily N-acetyltransferase
VTAPNWRVQRIQQNDPQAWSRETAQIHVTELKEGSLRNLGVDGLEIIYAAMPAIPRSGLWCAIGEERVLGFVAGCADIRQFYRYLMLRSAWKLAVKSFSSVRQTRSFGNLWKAASYPFSRSQWVETPAHFHETRAELLAISVSRVFQHNGIGRALVEQLEAGFREWGVGEFYHVATDCRDPLSNTFYAGMGYEKYGVKKFTNFSLQIYEKRI